MDFCPNLCFFYQIWTKTVFCFGKRIMHRIYFRPFFLSKCMAYLIEHGFDWGAYQYLSFHENKKTQMGGGIAHFFIAFFITLFLYHGHFISCQKANG